MPRRMVDAFKKEIEGEKEPPKGAEEVIKETLTMNPRRQEILQYVCRYPCSRLAKISKDLELSMAATKWHLERLVEKTFIIKEDIAGEFVFYPVNMIDEKDVKTLSAINDERANPILRNIMKHSGIKQKDLYENVQLNQRTVIRHATALEKVGLIESIQDGKFKRYYPTKLIDKMEGDYRKRAGRFRKHMLKMLKKDGVSPKVIRTTDRDFHVRITAGEKNSTLELNTQPFISVRERYRGL
jgi:predicted ArsR family transcriptional regulator